MAEWESVLSGLVGIALLLLAQRTYLAWRERGRVDLGLEIREGSTAVRAEGLTEPIQVENVVLLSGHGRTVKAVRFGGTREWDESVGATLRLVDLVHDSQGLQADELTQLWGAFLLHCCETVLAQLGRPRARIRATARLVIGDPRIETVITRALQTPTLRMLGEISLDDVRY